MGAGEYAGGPVFLLVIYALGWFVSEGIKEQGFIRTLGDLGQMLWFFLRWYLIVVPFFIGLWLVSLIGVRGLFGTVAGMALGAFIALKTFKHFERASKDK